MAFAWEPKYWATVEDFKRYLKTIKPATWAKGITFHHTAAPDQSQWQGMTHVQNLGYYYQYVVPNPDGSRGWPAGPHLFLAAGTKYDGIYQGTPLGTQGVHAGPCNSSRWGFEIVGNFNTKNWDPAVQELVYGVFMAFREWAAIPVKEYWAHRECMPGHTDCPGVMVNPDAVRAELYSRINATNNPNPIPPVQVYTRIIGVPPSAPFDAYWRSIQRNMPKGGGGEDLLTEHDAKFLYDGAAEFGVDPIAILGIWAHEQGTAPYGKSPLGLLSRNPHNMRAPDDDWRWVVAHPKTGKPFYAYESWKIGLTYAMLHLKNYYGGYRHLYTLEEIIRVFAPATDGNDPEAYIADVKKTMQYIQTH